ncbi:MULTISPECIES: hypothetical protein [unclassified Methanosarcina]|uniref:hypothetical protein n=1 Tax=unclassified Methanosarcina TaxID=2644672 RepID=UPI0009E44A86|nr:MULTISPECIES: hypothetical protein [unclassified Methanosarcina]
MRINIALALTSVVFMMTWVTGFVSVIFRSMSIITPDFIASDLLFITIIELLSIISLFGSLLFLLETRKTLARWYLTIPLCISLSAFVITNFLVYSNGKSFLGNPVSAIETLWIIILVFLSPCSALLFLSSNGHCGSTNVYVAVSSATSVFSMFFLILALREISKWSSIEAVLLPLAFYWTICMPAIGVCFLSKATMYGADNVQEEPSD